VCARELYADHVTAVLVSTTSAASLHRPPVPLVSATSAEDLDRESQIHSLFRDVRTHNPMRKMLVGKSLGAAAYCCCLGIGGARIGLSILENTQVGEEVSGGKINIGSCS